MFKKIDTTYIAIITIMICTYIIPSGFIPTEYDFAKLIFAGVFCILILLSKKIKLFDIIFGLVLVALTYFSKNISFMTLLPLLYLSVITDNKDKVEEKILKGNILYICLLFTIIYTFIGIYFVDMPDRGVVRYAFTGIVEKNQSAFAIFILGLLLLKKEKSIGIFTLILGLFTFSRLYFLSIFLFLLSKTKIVKIIVSKMKVKRWSYALLTIIFLVLILGIGCFYLYAWKNGLILTNGELKTRFSLLDYSNLQRFTVNIIFLYMLVVSPKKYLLFGMKESTYMDNVKYYAYHRFNVHNPGIVPHNLFLAHLKVYGLFTIFELFYTSKYLKKVVTNNNFIIFLIIVITSSILGCGLYSYWLYLSIIVLISYMGNKEVQLNE